MLFCSVIYISGINPISLKIDCALSRSAVTTVLLSVVLSSCLAFIRCGCLRHHYQSNTTSFLSFTLCFWQTSHWFHITALLNWALVYLFILSFFLTGWLKPKWPEVYCHILSQIQVNFTWWCISKGRLVYIYRCFFMI